MAHSPLNILCVSRFFKGNDFLRSAKSMGNRVFLLTSSNLKDEPWAWDAIDESFFVDEDANGNWNMEHVRNGLAYKMRAQKFEVLIALDDFDVENTAHLREHFRIPGMGETTCRYFRDKLAMRMKAKDAGIAVPEFTGLFYDADIQQFIDTVSPPWLVKPRTAASAMGITKCHDEASLWEHLNTMGDDQRHHYLLERFAPGDVYHVDGLNTDGKVVFARASRYLDTPLEVAQGGGIFRSQTLDVNSKDHKELLQLNKKLMKAFGMNFSATHSEFIKDHQSGKFYFLETASRVGGAHIAEMVEAASGINLWSEWAKIETAQANAISYKLPKVQKNEAGIIVSLSRFEHPDNHDFNDPEIVWRLDKKWHIGLIVKSNNTERIKALLDRYAEKIAKEYHASLPPEAPPV